MWIKYIINASDSGYDLTWNVLGVPGTRAMGSNT